MKSNWPVMLWMAVMCTGCARGPADTAGFPAAAVPVDAAQALVVEPVSPGPFHVRVTAWERRGGIWAVARPAMDGVVGRTGLAAPGAKREGDGHTPSGVYQIGTAFGYEPQIETGLAYRRATADDFWVDDPDSPQYNRWVTGPPMAKSFERLRRDDDLYKYAAVIEYNTDPVVPGRGSAIFLHVWGGRDSPTAGCVALSEENVRALLRWLDRSQNPVIVLGRE
jgi:L,D-peptidoglycan transpeptidase YkuD (ErfK/YbiS/YcfS/YnhG family)